MLVHGESNQMGRLQSELERDIRSILILASFDGQCLTAVGVVLCVAACVQAIVAKSEHSRGVNAKQLPRSTSFFAR